MKTLLTLVVDDSKVVPILRLIRHIGADQLDIRPIEEKLKALPKPEPEAGKPKRGSLTGDIIKVLSETDRPITSQQLVEILPQWKKPQIWGTLARLKFEKRVKKTKEGYKLNGS